MQLSCGTGLVLRPVVIRPRCSVSVRTSWRSTFWLLEEPKAEAGLIQATKAARTSNSVEERRVGLFQRDGTDVDFIAQEVIV